ncbi:MAG: hypothetical protein ACTHOB_00570 [Ginsengibacter sp.]
MAIPFVNLCALSAFVVKKTFAPAKEKSLSAQRISLFFYSVVGIPTDQSRDNLAPKDHGMSYL